MNLAEKISLFTTSFDLGAYVFNNEKTQFGFYGGVNLRSPIRRTPLTTQITEIRSEEGHNPILGHYNHGTEVTIHDENSELWNERVDRDNNSMFSVRFGALLKHQLPKKFAIEAMIDLNIYSRKVGNVNPYYTRYSYSSEKNFAFFFKAMSFGIGISRQLN